MEIPSHVVNEFNSLVASNPDKIIEWDGNKFVFLPKGIYQEIEQEYGLNLRGHISNPEFAQLIHEYKSFKNSKDMMIELKVHELNIKFLNDFHDYYKGHIQKLEIELQKKIDQEIEIAKITAQLKIDQETAIKENNYHEQQVVLNNLSIMLDEMQMTKDEMKVIMDELDHYHNENLKIKLERLEEQKIQAELNLEKLRQQTMTNLIVSTKEEVKRQAQINIQNHERLLNQAEAKLDEMIVRNENDKVVKENLLDIQSKLDKYYLQSLENSDIDKEERIDDYAYLVTKCGLVPDSDFQLPELTKEMIIEYIDEQRFAENPDEVVERINEVNEILNEAPEMYDYTIIDPSKINIADVINKASLISEGLGSSPIFNDSPMVKQFNSADMQLVQNINQGTVQESQEEIDKMINTVNPDADSYLTHAVKFRNDVLPFYILPHSVLTIARYIQMKFQINQVEDQFEVKGNEILNFTNDAIDVFCRLSGNNDLLAHIESEYLKFDAMIDEIKEEEEKTQSMAVFYSLKKNVSEHIVTYKSINSGKLHFINLEEALSIANDFVPFFLEVTNQYIISKLCQTKVMQDYLRLVYFEAVYNSLNYVNQNNQYFRLSDATIRSNANGIVDSMMTKYIAENVNVNYEIQFKETIEEYFPSELISELYSVILNYLPDHELAKIFDNRVFNNPVEMFNHFTSKLKTYKISKESISNFIKSDFIIDAGNVSGINMSSVTKLASYNNLLNKISTISINDTPFKTMDGKELFNIIQAENFSVVTMGSYHNDQMGFFKKLLKGALNFVKKVAPKILNNLKTIGRQIWKATHIIRKYNPLTMMVEGISKSVRMLVNSMPFLPPFIKDNIGFVLNIADSTVALMQEQDFNTKHFTAIYRNFKRLQFNVIVRPFSKLYMASVDLAKKLPITKDIYKYANKWSGGLGERAYLVSQMNIDIAKGVSVDFKTYVLNVGVLALSAYGGVSILAQQMAVNALVSSGVIKDEALANKVAALGIALASGAIAFDQIQSQVVDEFYKEVKEKTSETIVKVGARALGSEEYAKIALDLGGNIASSEETFLTAVVTEGEKVAREKGTSVVEKTVKAESQKILEPILGEYTKTALDIVSNREKRTEIVDAIVNYDETIKKLSSEIAKTENVKQMLIKEANEKILQEQIKIQNQIAIIQNDLTNPEQWVQNEVDKQVQIYEDKKNKIISEYENVLADKDRVIRELQKDMEIQNAIQKEMTKIENELAEFQDKIENQHNKVIEDIEKIINDLDPEVINDKFNEEIDRIKEQFDELPDKIQEEIDRFTDKINEEIERIRNQDLDKLVFEDILPDLVDYLENDLNPPPVMQPITKPNVPIYRPADPSLNRDYSNIFKWGIIGFGILGTAILVDTLLEE